MHADTDHEHVSTAFDCTVCGREQLSVRADRSVHCPDCDQPYSLLLRDGFSMVEANGWIYRVAVDSGADQVPVEAGE